MNPKEVKYVWSGTVRLLHWVIFLSVVALLITGNYIAHTPTWLKPRGEPFENFFMANMRFIHLTAAVVFDVSVLISIYLFFFSTFHTPWRDLMPTKKNLRNAWVQFKYYFRLSGEKVDYEYHDPVNIISWLSFYILAIFLMFTGFALRASVASLDWWWPKFVHLTTDWVVYLFGGLNGTRVAHHMLWWLILVWVVIHVYFQMWKTIKLKTGNINAIFGGYRYTKVEE